MLRPSFNNHIPHFWWLKPIWKIAGWTTLDLQPAPTHIRISAGSTSHFQWLKPILGGSNPQPPQQTLSPLLYSYTYPFISSFTKMISQMISI
jgi:hypothetical protein